MKRNPYFKDYMRRRQAGFRKRGLCHKCGKVPCPLGGCCDSCKSKNNSWEARQREKRLAEDPTYRPRSDWTRQAKNIVHRFEVMRDVQECLRACSGNEFRAWVDSEVRELRTAAAKITGRLMP